MGSFRVADMYAASSRQVQFHWVNPGDSKEVVMPFMQDGIYPPRNFATLGPSELQPPFTNVSAIKLYTISITFIAPGRPQTQYVMFSILQSPVFLLNSRSFYFLVDSESWKTYKINYSNTLSPLFPKLQSQFAEFLQDYFLNRFSIFYHFTCVGLSTVHSLQFSIRSKFLWFIFLSLSL